MSQKNKKGKKVPEPNPLSTNDVQILATHFGVPTTDIRRGNIVNVLAATISKQSFSDKDEISKSVEKEVARRLGPHHKLLTLLLLVVPLCISILGFIAYQAIDQKYLLDFITETKSISSASAQAAKHNQKLALRDVQSSTDFLFDTMQVGFPNHSNLAAIEANIEILRDLIDNPIKFENEGSEGQEFENGEFMQLLQQTLEVMKTLDGRMITNSQAIDALHTTAYNECERILLGWKKFNANGAMRLSQSLRRFSVGLEQKLVLLQGVIAVKLHYGKNKPIEQRELSWLNLGEANFKIVAASFGNGVPPMNVRLHQATVAGLRLAYAANSGNSKPRDIFILDAAAKEILDGALKACSVPRTKSIILNNLASGCFEMARWHINEGKSTWLNDSKLLLDQA